jgi:hypothetical protein
MGALVKLATALFGKLSFCALIGAIVGAIVGFLTGLLQVEHVAPLTLAEVLQVGFVLGLVGWIFVLVVVGMWLHYGTSVVFWPALLNALITGLLTVWINNIIRNQVLAALIGLFVGLLVGTLLCLWCNRDRRGAAYG